LYLKSYFDLLCAGFRHGTHRHNYLDRAIV